MAMTVWIVGAVEGGRRGDCLQDVCWIRIDGTSGWMIGSILSYSPLGQHSFLSGELTPPPCPCILVGLFITVSCPLATAMSI